MKKLFIILCGLFLLSTAYAEKIPFTWEKIGYLQDIGAHSYRVKVPGGWLLLTREYHGSTSIFVVDADHSWEVK